MRQPVASQEENEVRGCCCNRKVGVESAKLTISDMGLLPGRTVFKTAMISCEINRKMAFCLH